MSQANIELYTWATCPFCIRAKALLDSKGVAYKENNIQGDEDARDAMAAQSNGRRTVPQIFINGEWIGGCDDLHMLDAEGKLDKMLSKSM